MKALLTTLFVAIPLALFGPTLGSSSDGYKVGDTVANFSLKNHDGTAVSLAAYSEAEGVIVTFTCNTCPFSKLYEQRIIDLQTKYKDQGYPVIAINSNDPDQKAGDSLAAMKKRAADKGYNFPYLVDADGATARAFGATKTPHVFLLKNSAGGMKVAYIGAIDDNAQNASDVQEKYVEKAISELKAGKSVSKNFTRAIGCTIKFKS